MSFDAMTWTHGSCFFQDGIYVFWFVVAFLFFFQVKRELY